MVIGISGILAKHRALQFFSSNEKAVIKSIVIAEGPRSRDRVTPFDQISNWMSNNFDVTDYNVDDAIESWMDNNMDEKIQDAISNIEFSVTVK